MKKLVVYYSRTGRTKKIAEEIQERLNADIDEIRDVKNRAGILGWLSAGRDAGTKKATDLKEIDKQPSEYHVVIVGTPTWNGSVSVPIRTYLNKFIEDLQHVAVFSTGEGDEPGALEEMNQILRKRVFAGMHFVRKKEIDSDNYHEKLNIFIEKIKSFAL